MSHESEKQPVVRPRGISKRLLLSVLGVGLASSAAVYGSTASWTDQTLNPSNSVTAGTFSLTNNKSAASVFSATDIKPGNTGSGTVNIANAGTADMTVKLSQDTLTDTFAVGSLKLKIHDDTRDWCYWPATGSGACGTYGNWDATATVTDLTLPNSSGGAQWPNGESHTFSVDWMLDTSSPNGDQGQNGSFRLKWDATT